MNKRDLVVLSMALGLSATAAANDDSVFKQPEIHEAVRLSETTPEEAPVSIKLNDGQLALRYRLQTDGNGVLTHNVLQQLALFDVTIAFFKNRVCIDLRGTTGGTFESPWGNTGIGTGDVNLAFYLRRMSLTLNATSGLEVTVGSMAPSFGAGSENSYLDQDGYVMGYRARVAFDKGDLVVTGGYVGDYDDPNVFTRLKRLGEFNYAQVILTRALGEIVRASLDYTYLNGDHYARGAMQLDVSRWVKFLDTITIEDMLKVSSAGREAVSNILAVRLSKRFQDLFAGREMQAVLTYTYRTEAMDIPIGDKIFMGHGVRLNVLLPNLVAGARGKLGVYLDYIQSFTDFTRLRAELGLIFRF